MVKKEELFVLIKSLSRSEKRYFHLFCTREASGKNYRKLFEAINRQEAYDERAIKEQFKDEIFVRQLHVTKNYLRKLILKSLRNFHAGISRDAELKDTLRNIETLYNKELFTHCRRELKRAEVIARKYELTAGLVEVQSWKRKLEQAMHPDNYGAFKEALTEQEKAIEILQNSNAYWQLSVDMAANGMGGRKGILRNENLLNNPENALTLETKILHFNTASLRHLQRGNRDEAVKTLYRLITLLEQHPHHLQENPGMYVSSINNLSGYLVFAKKYAEALKLIHKAKSIGMGRKIPSENRVLLKQVLRTYNIELEIYRNTEEFGEKTDFIESIEEFITANKHRMPKEYLVSFWFQLAYIHFMRNDFNRSLKWISKLLNSRFKERPDLQIQANMLNLMVHLELQNLFVLPYFVDSARRYLKKMREIQHFEQVLLKFFIAISKAPILEHKEKFSDLQRQLFPEDGEALVPVEILNYIDYERWIAGKLSQKK